MTTTITLTQNLINVLNAKFTTLINAQEELSKDQKKYKIVDAKLKINDVTNYIQVIVRGQVKFFVDASTGDILRAARYSHPQAGVLGNVSDDNCVDLFTVNRIGVFLA